MKNLTYILLLLTIQSRTRIRLEQFTGCESTLFSDPSNFRVMKVDFADACTALEVCAEDYLKSRIMCLEAFQADMTTFCSEYTGLNGWRRRYCGRISDRNVLLAMELDEDVFKYFVPTPRFKAFILEDKAYLGCLDNADIAVVTTCATPAATHEFTFVELRDEKWAIQDSAGLCFTSSVGLEECDYENESQQFKIIAGTADGAKAIESVKDATFLKLDVANTAATFDAATADVFISVFEAISNE